MNRSPLPRLLPLPLALALLAAPAPRAPAEDPAPDPVELAQKGLARWNDELREGPGNHYRYTVTQTFMVGAQTTTIEVKDHKVVRRTFEQLGEWVPNPDPGAPATRELLEKWIEEGDQIGTHDAGAPPLTLDQIYADALAIAQAPTSPDHRLYAKLDDNGLIIHLFRIDTRIADDAPREGIFLSQIELLGAGE